MRVLQIVTYMGRGGLETMIMNYFRNIDRTKIQFDFLVHRDFKADYDEEIENLGGKIYRMPVLNPFSKGYFKALDDFFAKHNYDVVHSHLDCMSAYPLKIAKKHGVKIRIAHAHSKSQDKDLKYPVKLFSKRLIPKYATHLFACGKEAGDWMFGGSSFRILNNAIDVQKYVFDPEVRNSVKDELGLHNEFVIGHIGRFNPPKNHTFLIDIFNEILQRNTHCKLLLVGSGNGETAIKDKVNQLGISDKVLFLGTRSDVDRILQAMDVFVFPSLYEGLPLSIIEAQAAGLPCVASTEVPIECKKTDLVTNVSLNKDAGYWAEIILDKVSQKRKNTYDEIKSSGYDVVENVRFLEELYLGL